MGIDLALVSAPTSGTRLPIATNDATGASFSDGVHGDEQLQATFPRTLVEALAVYEAPVPHVVVSEHGAPIAQYRLEQPALSDEQLSMTALGSSRAFSDVVVTTLWSTASYEDWRPATTNDRSDRRAQLGEFDQENRLYLAPRTGETFGFGPPSFGIAQTFAVRGANGGRPILGISFDYRVTAPANWQAILSTWTRDYQTPLATPWFVNTTGTLQSGSIHGTIGTPCDRLEFVLFYNAPNAVYAGATGGAFLEIRNLRVVTSTTNQLVTTFSAATVAGANVTATVGSTSGMYVGQRLWVAQAGTGAESVVVKSVISATQFVADFAFAHTSGQFLQAWFVRPDEVATDVLARVTALNPTQLRPTTAQIQPCPQDQTDLAYERATGDVILNDLETRTGWRWAVRNRVLSFAPSGTNAQTWYVDAASLELQRTLDDLANRASTLR